MIIHANFMKCQILFSGKNKENISRCRLLKITQNAKCYGLRGLDTLRFSEQNINLFV